MTTLEWGDTFDHYTKAQFTTFANSPASRKWTTELNAGTRWIVDPLYARPGSPAGSGARMNDAGGDRGWLKTLPLGAQATRCISVWWNPVLANTTSGQAIIALYDGSAEQLSVRLTGSAQLIVTRAGTTLATSTNTVSQNTWYHLQLKATINNTTGAYELRVNGTSTGWVPAATGANTRGTGTNNSSTQCYMGGGGNWSFDDYVVADDFTGVVVGAFIQGAAPGNHQDWAANSGSNRAAVEAIDDDASFVSSTTSGDIDTYVMTALPAGGTPTILGVQHIIYAKQDAGVQRTLRPKMRAASTDYSGASVNTTATYTMIVEAASVSPNTGVAWTKTSFEATEFGYENV